MKVIGVDNFDRDNVSDVLFLDELTEKTAKEVAERLNKRDENGPRFYKVVPDDYELYKFEP